MSGLDSQKKGKLLEEVLAKLIDRLLFNLGCKILDGPRIEPVGSQHGRDIVVRFSYPFSLHIWTIVFECKNQSSGKLTIDDFAGKLYQAASSALNIDAWIVIAPHVCLSTEAYDYLPQLQSKFMFNVAVLTPDQKVSDFFALDPELYESIYGNQADNKGDITYWQNWLSETLDNLDYLSRIISHSMPTLEIVHPGRIEKKKLSDEAQMQQLAQEFYKGQIPEWQHIANDLDFRRSYPRNRLSEIMQMAKGLGGVHFILALSEAGAGKSTFLMREALDASKNGAIVLYSAALPRENLLNNLVTCINFAQKRGSNRTVLLIIDNVAAVAEDLRKVILTLYNAGHPLIILAADRSNRWRSAIGDQSLEEGAKAQFPGRVYYITLSQLNDEEKREFITKIRQYSGNPKIAGVTDDELIAKLDQEYKGQLVVFLLELMEGKRFEAIVRDEAREFEKQFQPVGILYRATAAIHQFGVNIPETLLLRFLGINTGPQKDFYHSALEAARESRLLKVDQFNRLRTRHEIIAQALFEGMQLNAQKDLLVSLIEAVDSSEQHELVTIAKILVDSSCRSDVWMKPYRRDLYNAALQKFPSEPYFRDVAALLFIQEGDIESAYRVLELSDSRVNLVTLQNLARAETKKGHYETAFALYCKALSIPPNVSDDELLSFLNSEDKVENLLTNGRIDVVILTAFADFLSRKKRSIAIAILRCVNKSVKADAYCTHLLARLLNYAGELNEAVELLKDGRERFPSEAAVFSLELINILKRKKEDEQVIESAYQDAIKNRYVDAHLYLSYARYIRKKKGVGAAIDIFRDGMKSAPDPFLCLDFATLFESIGKDKEAEEVLRQSMEMFPLDNALYTELGLLLIRNNQSYEAHKIFKKGLGICPTSAHLHTAYALLLEGEKQYELAEIIFREGIKANSINGPIYNAFGLFLLGLNRSAEAEEVLRRGAEHALVHPETSLHSLARLLDSQKRESEAEEIYRSGIKRFPWHHHFYVDYGAHLVSRCRFRASLYCFKYGMQNTKDNAPLAQVLGRLLIRMWRDEEAINAFKEGLRSANRVREFHKRIKQQEAIYNEWSKLLWYRGQFEEAEKVANSGITISPKSPRILVTLAIALHSQGKSDLATKYFKKAVDYANNAEEKKRITDIFHNPARKIKIPNFKILQQDVRGRIKDINEIHPNAFGNIAFENGENVRFKIYKSGIFRVNEICEFDLAEYSNGDRVAMNVAPVDWEF